jgi:hypothetical protein
MTFLTARVDYWVINSTVKYFIPQMTVKDIDENRRFS